MINKQKCRKLLIVSIMFIILVVITYCNNNDNTVDCDVTQTVTTTPTPTPEATPTPTSTQSPTPSPTPIIKVESVEVPDVYEKLIKDVLEKVEQLETFNKENPTLYNTYSEEELELLFRVVEAEATDYSVECKSNVASVIFNRLKKGWWGGDLISSLMAKRQFEVITNGRYKRVTVTDETILACEIAFAGDTAQGALFFDSTKGKSWAHRNREFIFSDDVHWFYK